jgi:capsid portal protein
VSERKITKAYIVSSSDGDGRPSLVKAQDPTAESKQIEEQVFGIDGLATPPLDFGQLAMLLTSNTAHFRACAQKASDVAGRGYHIIADEGLEEQSAAVQAERDRIDEFLANVNPKRTLREVLEAVAFDYEAIGWGFLELVLNGKDELVELNHIPAHTMRAHSDGKRFVQIRGQQKAWFMDVAVANPWNMDTDQPRRYIDVRTGDLSETEPEAEFSGNAVIPFVHYSPLSSWYGLPDFVPAIGAMATNTAISAFNLQFIEHNTIPQYAVVVQGAELGDELEETIIDYFSNHVQGESRATLVIPIPYSEDQVKVTFEKLASETNDGGFLSLRDANTVETLIAHGVPPYRVGWAVLGGLGGNVGHEMIEVYKDAIVEARQEVIEHRFNKYVIRGALAATQVSWKLNEIDLTDRMAEVALANQAIEYGLMTPAEAREEVLGKEPGDAPDTFFLSSTLRPANAPDPTTAEADMAQMKRISRDLRKGAFDVQRELDATLAEFRARREQRSE